MSMILINEKIDYRTVSSICSYLRRGYAVLIKTDTQWGLMAMDPVTIYSIKRRPENKKIVRLVPPTFKFLRLSLQQKMFVKKFWPGSVTIIKGGESYRLADNNMINAILQSMDQPVFCSSANVSGGDPIHTIEEAVTVFNHAARDIIGVIPRKDEDREWCDSLPSTIVDIDYWYIVRKGKRYHEVLDFIANHIIPSYKEIRDELEKGYRDLQNAGINKIDYSNPFLGIPLISVSDNKDIREIRKANKGKSYRDDMRIKKVVYYYSRSEDKPDKKIEKDKKDKDRKKDKKNKDKNKKSK